MQLNLDRLNFRKYLDENSITAEFCDLMPCFEIPGRNFYHWVSLDIYQIQVQFRELDWTQSGENSRLVSDLITTPSDQISKVVAGSLKKDHLSMQIHKSYASASIGSLEFNLNPHNRDDYENFIDGLDVFSDSDLRKKMQKSTENTSWTPVTTSTLTSTSTLTTTSTLTSTSTLTTTSTSPPMDISQPVHWLVLHASLPKITLKLHSYFASKTLKHFANMEISDGQLDYSINSFQSNLILQAKSITADGKSIPNIPKEIRLMSLSNVRIPIFFYPRRSVTKNVGYYDVNNSAIYDYVIQAGTMDTLSLILHPETIAKVVRIFLFPSRKSSISASRLQVSSNKSNPLFKGSFSVREAEGCFWSNGSSLAKLRLSEVSCEVKMEQALELRFVTHSAILLGSQSPSSDESVLINFGSQPTRLMIGQQRNNSQDLHCLMNMDSEDGFSANFAIDFILDFVDHLRSYGPVFTFLTAHDHDEESIVDNLFNNEQPENEQSWSIKISLGASCIGIRGTHSDSFSLLFSMREFKFGTDPRSASKPHFSLDGLELNLVPFSQILPVSYFDISKITSRLSSLENTSFELDFDILSSKKISCLNFLGKLKSYSFSNPKLFFCHAIYIRLLRLIREFSSSGPTRLERLRDCSILETRTLEAKLLRNLLDSKLKSTIFFKLEIDTLDCTLYEFEFGNLLPDVAHLTPSFAVRVMLSLLLKKI